MKSLFKFDLRAIDWFICTAILTLIFVSPLLFFFIAFDFNKLLIAISLAYFLSIGVSFGYHRLLAHRSYSTSRALQFLFCLLAVLTNFRGPLYWCAMHRNHHQYSDTEKDFHSPVVRGFLNSHILFLYNKNIIKLNRTKVKDLLKFKELIFLDNFSYLPSIIFISVLFFCWGSSGVFWFYLIPNFFVLNSTFSINSICHVLGYRNFNTRDTSRNNLIFGYLSWGEGWHNNHHQYPSRTNFGIRKHEMDSAYIVLKIFEKLGLVWDVDKFNGLRKNLL